MKMFSRVSPDVVRSVSIRLGELRCCMVYSRHDVFDFVRLAMKFDHYCWPNLVCFVWVDGACGAHLGLRQMI